MADAFQSAGESGEAPFTLKLHRGEGMVLIAMNWKSGRPAANFVGFGIQYSEPGPVHWYDLKNRLGFPGADGKVDPTRLSTMQSPIQKWRWVHFPRRPELAGEFAYRVTPVFMNEAGELSYGVEQEAKVVLADETGPGVLNIAFTRGFISSQAFVERYERFGPIATLLPAKAGGGLAFTPTHPKAAEALEWMGLEARREVLKLLDDAIADGADVKAIAYDLNVPEVVDRFERLGSRLQLIIDDDGAHGEAGSPESAAEARVRISAGAGQVKRQHMGKLQHNKMIVANGPTLKRALGGSTNFSWRGFYVQANNAVFVTGAGAVAPFLAAFDQYWRSDDPAAFGRSPSAAWQDLLLPGIDGKVCFSPHAAANAVLAEIGADMNGATSNLLFSLAFLFEISGPILDAVKTQTARDDVFVYGISDRKVGGIDVLKPDGNVAPVYPSALKKNVPLPFSAEPTGGGGTRMHHKFVVIDFGTPDARVYAGSYNFSPAADGSNGENLFVFRDPRVVASYTIEALRLFDSYHFRVAQGDARRARRTLTLQRPPSGGDVPWFDEDFTVARKIKDRELFA